jgi:hypothetical protein
MISENMSQYNRFHLVCKVFLLAILSALAFSACNSEAEQVQRLRINNSGSIPIQNLVVRFPHDNIAFGDVPAGTTTDYKEVPNGVYRYAAYQFEFDGETLTQPVIDWLGEDPMSGTSFTYTLDFDPDRVNTGDRIRLVDVKNDD